MTVEESTPMSPEELVVSVEQADALIDLIGIEAIQPHVERGACQWTCRRWPCRH